MYITVPARDGNEGNILGIVSDFLDKVGRLLDNFLISGFGPFCGIHLVNGNNELFDTQSVGQQSMFTGLTIFGDTGFELADTSSNNHCSCQPNRLHVNWEHTDSTISLGGPRNHVLDEIAMSGSVDDGDIVLGSLKLPKSNVDGDTTLTFRF